MSSHRRPYCTGFAEAGFTLMELVLVLVIMGILAAAVAPRFFEKDPFEERGFFDETLGALRYAQKLAVASGCEVQVTVNSGGFELRQRNNCTAGQPFTQTVAHPGGCRNPANPPPANTFDCNAPTGLTVSGAPHTVVFNALGQANGALSFSIGPHTLSVVRETGLAYKP